MSTLPFAARHCRDIFSCGTYSNTESMTSKTRHRRKNRVSSENPADRAIVFLLWGSGNTLQCFWLYLEGGLLIGKVWEGYAEQRKDCLQKYAAWVWRTCLKTKLVGVAEVKKSRAWGWAGEQEQWVMQNCGRTFSKEVVSVNVFWRLEHFLWGGSIKWRKTRDRAINLGTIVFAPKPRGAGSYTTQARCEHSGHDVRWPIGASRWHCTDLQPWGWGAFGRVKSDPSPPSRTCKFNLEWTKKCCTCQKFLWTDFAQGWPGQALVYGNPAHTVTAAYHAGTWRAAHPQGLNRVRQKDHSWLLYKLSSLA